MGGALETHFLPMGSISLWTVISMTAIMSGTMRSPLTGMIFTIELTHNLDLLPALLVCSIAAHATTVLLMRRSILTQKVARRRYHIYREYVVDPLTTVRVSEVMDTNPPIVNASMKLAELSHRVAARDPDLTRRHGILIVDDSSNLVGLITRGDIFREMGKPSFLSAGVLEAGSQDLVITYPDEPMSEAVGKMAKQRIGRLPVVSRENSSRIVGYIGRSSILAARMKRLEEEQITEPGVLLMRRNGIKKYFKDRKVAKA